MLLCTACVPLEPWSDPLPAAVVLAVTAVLAAAGFAHSKARGGSVLRSVAFQDAAATAGLRAVLLTVLTFTR